ncbi:hypothetical protein ILYODFUR_019753 [Ilyodon furcidens]|uniref:Uncharacterized protein n=1 Tax=Ilyodon furcidens TaxID=33524 RepID=A0ABV0SYP1_9TELE
MTPPRSLLCSLWCVLLLGVGSLLLLVHLQHLTDSVPQQNTVHLLQIQFISCKITFAQFKVKYHQKL